MKIEIKASPKEIKDGHFDYSNIESEYGCNTLYFTKNGKPYSIIAGEMHFARVPKERWKETLLKMRECGVNTVSTYVFWNYHEEIKGQFDFSGNKDIAGFLRLCKDIDMPCILRIGPWCHAEVVYGDFPKRINKMIRKRTDSPEYLAEVKEYWQGLYKEVAPYLDGKTVIGIQIDNEYTGPIKHLLTLRKLAEEIGYLSLIHISEPTRQEAISTIAFCRWQEVIPTVLGTAVKKNSSQTIVLPSLLQERRTKSAEIYSKAKKPKAVCLTTFLTELAKQDRAIR